MGARNVVGEFLIIFEQISIEWNTPDRMVGKGEFSGVARIVARDEPIELSFVRRVGMSTGNLRRSGSMTNSCKKV